MENQIDKKILEYQNKSIDNYNMKTVNITDEEALKEYEKFKGKLEVFNDIKHIKDAKELVKQMFNIRNEVNFIKAGNGHCVIISRAKLLRIVLSSEQEVICYNFSSKKEIK